MIHSLCSFIPWLGKVPPQKSPSQVVPLEVWSIIAGQCDSRSLLSCALTNKELTKIFLQEAFCRQFPEALIKGIGKDVLYQSPRIHLDLPPSYNEISQTEKDQIVRQLASHHIGVGFLSQNRPFICIRYDLDEDHLLVLHRIKKDSSNPNWRVCDTKREEKSEARQIFNLGWIERDQKRPMKFIKEVTKNLIV